MLLAAQELETSICGSAMIPLLLATFFYLQANWPNTQSHRVRAVVSFVVGVSAVGGHIDDLIEKCEFNGEAPATLRQKVSCAVAVVAALCSAVLLSTSLGWWKRDINGASLILEPSQEYVKITDVKITGDDIGCTGSNPS